MTRTYLQSASRGGVLNQDDQISWQDRTGQVLAQVGKPGRFWSMRMSPDQKSAAVVIQKNDRGAELWIMDLGTGVLAPLTSSGQESGLNTPTWSPDSTRLVFPTPDGGLDEATIASGRIRTITTDPLIPEDWTPDGRSILCRDASFTRLFLLSLSDGAKPQTIVTTSYRMLGAVFSPDGKYLAYASNEAGGARDIYVASFPSFSVKRRISTGGAGYPQWGAAGKKLYYMSSAGDITEVDITTVATIQAGSPTTLFQIVRSGERNEPFNVSPDGQRFLVRELIGINRPGDEEALHVAVN